MLADALPSIFIAVIITYFIGSIASLLLYKHDRLSSTISNTVSIIASGMGLVLAITKLLLFSSTEYMFKLDTGITPIEISFHLDNLSAFFILIISLLTLVVSIYSYDYMTHYFKKYNIGLFGFLYNIFSASMLMVVASGQLFFFLVVWELMSLISYFLVIYEHDDPNAQKAGKIYIIMTHIGTAFISAAFILIFKYTGTADLSMLDPSLIPGQVKNLVFLFLLIGFGTKAGIIPMHIWLPYAHPSAPSNVSALMSGVMLKTAIYGMLRFIPSIAGGESEWWGAAVMVVGALSAILGVAYALMENDIKRLLAYSSIENIGILLLGLGLMLLSIARGDTLTASLCLCAVLLHAFNHTVFKGLMFLGAGSILYSTHTRDMEKLGGLIRKLPYTSVFLMAGVLSISAIPPFNGFVSEWLTYQSLFVTILKSESWIKILCILAAALLSMAGAIAVYCFVKLYGISFLALPRSSNASKAVEVPKSMLLSMGILAVLCLVTGVFPRMIIKLINPVAADILGVQTSNRLTGFSNMLMLPVNANNSTISPFALVLLVMLLLPVVLCVVYLMKGKAGTRSYGTWDCGYIKLNAKMQYTATGFSKPLRIILRGIFRPQRELKKEEGVSPYFFKSAKYIVSTQSVFERYLYEPVTRTVMNFARRFRLVVQTGSIHTYLIYIFVALIAMFIYYAKS